MRQCKRGVGSSVGVGDWRYSSTSQCKRGARHSTVQYCIVATVTSGRRYGRSDHKECGHQHPSGRRNTFVQEEVRVWGGHRRRTEASSHPRLSRTYLLIVASSVRRQYCRIGRDSIRSRQDFWAQISEISHIKFPCGSARER